MLCIGKCIEKQILADLSWFNWWVSFAPEFQCCYFCESSCFILVLILISMFLR